MKQLQRILLIGLILPVFFSCSNEKKLLFNSYLELNLNSGAVSLNPFAKQTSLLEIIKVIEKAKQDNNIQGIILNIGSISRTTDNIWELRASLEEFKVSGKKIVAYINNADIDTYMLASIADKIAMDELGTLELTGYSYGKNYLSQMFDKLGIGVTELRYFDYKSAAESYTRTNMSEADRRQTEEYLDDIFTLTRTTLMRARGWSQEEFYEIINNDFLHSSLSAKERGLVDYIGGFDAVQNAINDLEGDKLITYRLYGESSASLTSNNSAISSLTKYTVASAKGNIIAVVNADGETDMARGMEIAKLSKTIKSLADNLRVKAIIVRVNSPGGSAQASEYFAEALYYAKERKPVVVSMGQVAASGGYWVSLPADCIIANPYTITGSIGVISTWFYDKGLNEKIGMSFDVIKRGDHSDLYTGFLVPYRDLTEQEEAQFKKMILDIYGMFMDRVADARNMDKARVANLAQGRIYSGTRAFDAGLVDKTGSLMDALNKARELAGIAEDAAVNYREYPEPTFMDNLLNGIFSVQANNELLNTITDAVQYRLENNGKAMPIMPLEFCLD